MYPNYYCYYILLLLLFNSIALVWLSCLDGYSTFSPIQMNLH